MQSFLTSLGYDDWILPALLLIPLLGAAVILVVARSTRGLPSGHPSSEPEVSRAAAGGDVFETGPARTIALWTLVLEFVVSLGLWFAYRPGASATYGAVDLPWIEDWGVRFTLGIDGIALMMILLTTFTMPLAVLGSWTGIRTKPRAYYALLLLLTSGLLGVFMARDLFLFYVFWEIALVPMYFIVGIWGGERRIYASVKFFIYTMLGSLLMLVAIGYLGIKAGGPPLAPDWTPNFAYDAVMTAAHAAGGDARLGLIGTMPVSIVLFFAFFLAFAVKVPMFPFHTWLPDAHVEAPTAGSVVLAGIMLKMGTYGFIRFALPFFPEAAMTGWVRGLVLGLAVTGILYGALVAMVQPDFKKLVAYSSVSHLGFVMLGIFALTVQSVQGALMVMINHGISTGALFFLVGMIYERRHTRQISAYGGIAKVVPMFAALLTLVSLSSIGLPGTNGFIGEFLVLIGSFRSHPWLATIAATGVIFAAAYLLWAIQRILFNALDRPENAHITDLNRRELLLMAPLVGAIIWLGVYPQPVLERMEPAARALVQRVEGGAARGVAATQGAR